MTLTSAFLLPDMIVADVNDAVCLTPRIETCNVDITFNSNTINERRSKNDARVSE